MGMDERTIDRHSVNCFECGELVDERECIPGVDGEGDICEVCQRKLFLECRNDDECPLCHSGTIYVDNTVTVFCRGECGTAMAMIRTHEESIADLGYIKRYAQTILDDGSMVTDPNALSKETFLRQIIELADKVYQRIRDDD